MSDLSKALRYTVMEESAEIKPLASERLLRCADWLQKQNSQEPKKLSLQNKNVNDIQFILETNATRKKFLLTAAEDEATVPDGVNEPKVKPQAVPLHKLRLDKLRLECEWQSCNWVTENYEGFQKHVRDHIWDLNVTESKGCAKYVCMWDICGHKTEDPKQMVRHINYHAYHAKLLAIGFNGRATLKLVSCKKDSSKRNQIPPLLSDHICMWTGCGDTFSSVQIFFDHIKLHIKYADKKVCSWAGCGAKFQRRAIFTMHVRSHTGEKLIACFHCGQQFSCNRKLCDHLRRQNAHPACGYTCTMCGISCATEYLLREHTRAHVSVYACTLCDMSAPTLSALATHVRYRHLGARPEMRTHCCPHCDYRAITKWDLRKHVARHYRKNTKLKKVPKIKKEETSDKSELSDEENDCNVYKQKAETQVKQYICHMCPEKEPKIFSVGHYLTTHLVKIHGVQWPFGHSRFRYQISEDGMYRLTTTRYESLEVSKIIVDGGSEPKTPMLSDLNFDLVQTSEPTDKTPYQFEIALRKAKEENIGSDNERTSAVEITMCDVDEYGNIIKSDVYYT